MQAIPEKDRAPDSLIRLESELPGMHPVTKALSLKWNTRTDTLVFTIELDSLKLKSEKLYTKRELASLAAKIFEPMGLILPFTVRSKLCFRVCGPRVLVGMMSYLKKPLGSGSSGFKSFQRLNSFTFQEVTLIGL